MKSINIIVIVDVIGALSLSSLRSALYMADTSWNSQGQGTESLSTNCYPGQRLNWSIHAIDVQTPVLIKSIAFLDEDRKDFVGERFAVAPTSGTEPHWYYWTGIVPSYLPHARYPYSIKLQMGAGENSVLYADTPSLNVVLP